MKPLFHLFAAACTLAALSSPAHAGPQGDALSACLASSLADADRDALLRWTYVAIGRHPALADIAQVDDARRTEAERAAGRVIERLVVEDCAAQTRDALRAEGPDGVGEALKGVGSAALGDVAGHPAVSESMAGLLSRIDQKKLLQVLLAP